MEDEFYQDHIVSFTLTFYRADHFLKLGNLEEYNKSHSDFMVRLKFQGSLTPPPRP